MVKEAFLRSGNARIFGAGPKHVGHHRGQKFENFFLENDSLVVNSMRKIDFSRFQSPKTITLR